MARTAGQYYVAERTLWHGEVRMIRTTLDKSAVIGVTNDGDATVFAAVPSLMENLDSCVMEMQTMLSLIPGGVDTTTIRGSMRRAKALLKELDYPKVKSQ